MSSRLNWLLLTFLLSTLPFGINSANGATFKPYQIKAVYIFRIANFIKWDNESEKQSLRFCVEGSNKVKEALASIIQGKTIRALNLELLATSHPDDCDIIYLSASKYKQATIYGEHSVTISDHKGFVRKGGVIELQTKNNKIRPRINLSNANLDDYTIGSSLLRIAIVEDK